MVFVFNCPVGALSVLASFLNEIVGLSAAEDGLFLAGIVVRML